MDTLRLPGFRLFRGFPFRSAAFFALLLLESQVLAQGTITGTVTNAATGRTLEGARIVVQGTSHEVFSDPDGTFRLVGVPPGRYRLDHSAGRAFDDWRLVSATIKGREVLDSSIEIRAGEDLSDVVLRFTDRPSELAGRLQTSTGQPATAYSIIVFSATREFWLPLSRRVRSLRPATDGGFSVRGLPAGEYYIAALTDVEPGEWYDPAFLAQLIATSAKVVVKDGARTVQDLMIK